VSIEMATVEQDSKFLEVARFTPETLKVATNNFRTAGLVCGFKKKPRVAWGTHVLIEAKIDGSYKVIGDGWATTEPREDDDRFGADYPYTVRLTSVSIIEDPENFIESPLAWPARQISADVEAETFVNAMRALVEMDYMWFAGMTSTPQVMRNWDM